MSDLRSVFVLVAGEAIEILLDNDDGEADWGSGRDAKGNRIEVYVYDGDPYADKGAA